MSAVSLEQDGIVSLWVGQRRVAVASNFLRDQFGVHDYDPDNQECIVEASPTAFSDLIAQLSYSDSFQKAALEAAERVGIVSILWVMAQFDYAYDPSTSGITSLPSEPVFIGKFPWHE